MQDKCKLFQKTSMAGRFLFVVFCIIKTDTAGKLRYHESRQIHGAHPFWGLGLQNGGAGLTENEQVLGARKDMWENSPRQLFQALGSKPKEELTASSRAPYND